MTRVWTVRAGDGGSLYDLARQESLTFIGWSEMGDLADVADEATLRDLVERTFAGRSVEQSFGQVRRFRYEIAPGDIVCIPAPGGSPIAVGEVTGGYAFRPDLPAQARNTRAIRWLGELPRASLPDDLRRSLSSILTVFEVSDPRAAERITALIDGLPDPFPPTPAEHSETTASVGAQQRAYELMRALAEILAQSDSAVPKRLAIGTLREMLPPEGNELESFPSGGERYETIVSFYSIDLVKAGWLVKSRSGWLLTPAGHKALNDYPEASAFGAEAGRLYRKWRSETEKLARQERRETALRTLVSRIPAGRWASFTDVAAVVDLDRKDAGMWIWNNKPAGWHRVLRSDGSASGGHYPDEGSQQHAEEQRRMLLREGLTVDPRAPSDAQMEPAELSLLNADAGGQRHAWLVRGSSVAGLNLVPVWLEEGYVSLPATNIAEIDPPYERDAIGQVIDVAFAGRASDYRRRKLDAYDRFLRGIQADDFVLTTADGEVYLGRVTGEPMWNSDSPRPDILQRTVAWEVDGGLAFADLPDPLPERLKSAEDVADLSDVGALLEGLLVPEDDDIEPVPEDDVVAAPVGQPARLLAPDQSLAAKLHLSVDWLTKATRILQRRNQIIFYGPPGTGKTYVAQALAEHYTDAGNVRIVQFHPSYTYEDFIEGYRPELVDGQVMFRVRQGPLMQIAEQARDNPGTPFVLIIDEINRANLAKVFGELYFLLEYRKTPIRTLYAEEGAREFTLPPNLFIIGTMNTADRSIALVDAAMRRRFAFVSMHPADAHIRGMLRDWLDSRNLPEETAALLDELNGRIGDADFQVGPSHFMRPWLYDDPDGLADVWESDIVPLLEEHHAGEDLDIDARYGLAALQKSVTATSVLREAETPTGDGDGEPQPENPALGQEPSDGDE